MSFSKAHNSQTYISKSYIVGTRVDLSRKPCCFFIVGLPDKATEESRDQKDNRKIESKLSIFPGTLSRFDSTHFNKWEEANPD